MFEAHGDLVKAAADALPLAAVMDAASHVDWTLVWVGFSSVILPVLVACVVPHDQQPLSWWSFGTHGEFEAPADDNEQRAAADAPSEAWPFPHPPSSYSLAAFTARVLSRAPPRLTACVLATLGAYVALLAKLGSAMPRWAKPDRPFRALAMMACARGDADVLMLLLRIGAVSVADADASGAPMYLHYAAGRGHTAVVQLLLRFGADANSASYDGWRPLHKAASRDRTAIMRLLLRHGAHVDARTAGGRTALHVAVRRNKVGAVQLLLDAGANWAARDDAKRTPWGVAAPAAARVIHEWRARQTLFRMAARATALEAQRDQAMRAAVGALPGAIRTLVGEAAAY